MVCPMHRDQKLRSCDHKHHSNHFLRDSPPNTAPFLRSLRTHLMRFWQMIRLNLVSSLKLQLLIFLISVIYFGLNICSSRLISVIFYLWICIVNFLLDWFVKISPNASWKLTAVMNLIWFICSSFHFPILCSKCRLLKKQKQ